VKKTKNFARLGGAVTAVLLAVSLATVSTAHAENDQRDRASKADQKGNAKETKDAKDVKDLKDNESGEKTRAMMMKRRDPKPRTLAKRHTALRSLVTTTTDVISM
jgi:hypothetical protein